MPEKQPPWAVVRLGGKDWTLRAPPPGGRMRVSYASGVPFSTAKGFYLRLAKGVKVKGPSLKMYAELKAADLPVPPGIAYASRKKRPKYFKTFLRSAAAFIRAHYAGRLRDRVPGRDVTYEQIAKALDDLAPQMKRTPGAPSPGLLEALGDVFESVIDVVTHPAFIAALAAVTGGLAAPGLAGAIAAIEELADGAGEVADTAKKVIEDASKVADAADPKIKKRAQKKLREETRRFASLLDDEIKHGGLYVPRARATVAPGMFQRGPAPKKKRGILFKLQARDKAFKPSDPRVEKKKKPPKAQPMPTRPTGAKRYRLGRYIVDVRETE